MSILRNSMKKSMPPADAAGTPDLAVAYAVRRKPKKMAKGGMVEGAEDDSVVAPAPRKPDNHRLPEDEYMADHFADGGIVEKIMAKRRVPDGQVDIQENGEEMPNQFDDLNEMAVKKELYDDEQLSPQPMDSNEHGDDLTDADAHDMVDMIRRKIKAKRGM